MLFMLTLSGRIKDGTNGDIAVDQYHRYKACTFLSYWFRLWTPLKNKLFVVYPFRNKIVSVFPFWKWFVTFPFWGQQPTVILCLYLLIELFLLVYFYNWNELKENESPCNITSYPKNLISMIRPCILNSHSFFLVKP